MPEQTNIPLSEGAVGIATGGQLFPQVGQVLGGAVRGFLNSAPAPAGDPGSAGFPLGNEVFSNGGCAPKCNPDADKRFKLCNGVLVEVKKRRRRRRLLSQSDKVDLGYLIGQLGKGAAGQAAISSLLARCA